MPVPMMAMGAFMVTSSCLLYTSKQTQFRAYSKEYAEIEPVIATFRELRKVQGDLEGAQALLKESDPDLREMAEEEVAQAKEALVILEDKLQRMLLPKDPNDGRNVYLEVRAGTGGDEAAIFSGDLFRMYSRYAEKQGWRVEVLSANEGEHGGFKEVIARVEGDNVYAKLKFESGAHRVQRVPETESQGLSLIHILANAWSLRCSIEMLRP